MDGGDDDGGDGDDDGDNDDDDDNDDDSSVDVDNDDDVHDDCGRVCRVGRVGHVGHVGLFCRLGDEDVLETSCHHYHTYSGTQGRYHPESC